MTEEVGEGVGGGGQHGVVNQKREEQTLTSPAELARKRLLGCRTGRGVVEAVQCDRDDVARVVEQTAVV